MPAESKRESYYEARILLRYWVLDRNRWLRALGRSAQNSAVNPDLGKIYAFDVPLRDPARPRHDWNE